MPASAAARARSAALTREEAIEIINAMPYLVCASQHNFLPVKCKRYRNPVSYPVVNVAFEVWNGSRKYVFEMQPFRILRRITREEYLAIVPNAVGGKYMYEICTD